MNREPSMGADDWAYVKNLARQEGVTLKQSGVTRNMRLGAAIDHILAASAELEG